VKVQILVRSADWLNTAGTRIRYLRLKQHMASLGWYLSVDPMASIREGLRLNADVYLFSKCQDAGALMLADMLREAGAIVGFDLFDDYFSGSQSLTFNHRVFKRALRGRSDFLLCSTERMAEIARKLDPDCPVHVLNDPHDVISQETLTQSLTTRLEAALASRTLEMVWFGHGSNPVFPVGLNDVVAFGSELRACAEAGWKVKLKVLSNAEALDASVLGCLQKLPTDVELEEWSEEAEATALDHALVAFLPVNYQDFSIAKSLNRGVSALVRGAQVLNLGFPLYEALDPYVYTSTKSLIENLERGELKLAPDKLDGLLTQLEAIANPQKEAYDLASFLDALPVLPAIPIDDRVLRGIIHGNSSPPAIHRLCNALGWLSLGSPFSQFQQACHAHIGVFEESIGTELRVSRDGFTRLGDVWRESARPLRRDDASGYTHVLDLPDTPAGRDLSSAKPEMWRTRSARILNFERLMSATRDVYADLFPNTRLLCSELEMPMVLEDQAIGEV
jgi:hypothetical protein